MNSYETFGKHFIDHLRSLSGFFGDEWSTHLMPLAANAGLAEWVAFDPEIHNNVEDVEPGDMFWHWLDTPVDPINMSQMAKGMKLKSQTGTWRVIAPSEHSTHPYHLVRVDPKPETGEIDSIQVDHHGFLLMPIWEDICLVKVLPDEPIPAPSINAIP